MHWHRQRGRTALPPIINSIFNSLPNFTYCAKLTAYRNLQTNGCVCSSCYNKFRGQHRFQYELVAAHLAVCGLSYTLMRCSICRKIITERRSIKSCSACENKITEHLTELYLTEGTVEDIPDPFILPLSGRYH